MLGFNADEMVRIGSTKYNAFDDFIVAMPKLETSLDRTRFPFIFIARNHNTKQRLGGNYTEVASFSACAFVVVSTMVTGDDP